MPQTPQRFTERTLPEWQDWYQSSSHAEERYRALQAIAHLTSGEVAIGWMQRGLQDQDSSVRAAAARWLVNSAAQLNRPGSDADWTSIHRAWEGLLHDDDPDVRFESARGVLALNPQSEPALAVLLHFLNDADTQPAMMASILQTLATAHVSTATIDWPRLMGHLQAEVREQAARTLGCWGSAVGQMAPLLLPLLDDEEPFVREEAARSLGLLAASSPEIRSALQLAAADDDAIVADTARSALQRLT